MKNIILLLALFLIPLQAEAGGVIHSKRLEKVVYRIGEERVSPEKFTAYVKKLLSVRARIEISIPLQDLAESWGTLVGLMGMEGVEEFEHIKDILGREGPSDDPLKEYLVDLNDSSDCGNNLTSSVNISDRVFGAGGEEEAEGEEAQEDRQGSLLVNTEIDQHLEEARKQKEERDNPRDTALGELPVGFEKHCPSKQEMAGFDFSGLDFFGGLSIVVNDRGGITIAGRGNLDGHADARSGSVEYDTSRNTGAVKNGDGDTIVRVGGSDGGSAPSDGGGTPSGRGETSDAGGTEWAGPDETGDSDGTAVSMPSPEGGGGSCQPGSSNPFCVKLSGGGQTGGSIKEGKEKVIMPNPEGTEGDLPGATIGGVHSWRQLFKKNCKEKVEKAGQPTPGSDNGSCSLLKGPVQMAGGGNPCAMVQCGDDETPTVVGNLCECR
ncbi:MAG: hypothetical protein HYS22_01665 [Deltaproteobacteria bacterium]|nr:hypothetical protein [Deltaproteobacteria bacterium]